MFPRSHLNRPTRIAIMLFFIVSFFIISPLIILYTAGYRYDFKNNQLKETGVISIDAEPADAQVFLNNIKINQKLSLWLPNRAPGVYKITLIKEGYQEWSKEITVESKQTTYIKNITLLKKALPILIFEDKKNEIRSAAISFDGLYSLLNINNINLSEIILLTNEEGRSNIIWHGTSSTNNPNFFWSSYNNISAIEINNGKENLLQLSDPSMLEKKISYNFSLPNKSNHKQWLINSQALISASSTLAEKKSKLYFLGLNGARFIGETSGTIWYVEDDNKKIIWTFDENNKVLKKYLESQLIISYSINKNILEIIDINPQRFIIRDESNNILIYKYSEKKISEQTSLPTQSLFYNSNKKEWLTWSPWELWSIYEDGSTALLNRLGEKINFVVPMDNYGMLLLATDNKLIAFNPGYYISHKLLVNAEIKNIGVDIKHRKIYFYGKVGQSSGIWELEY